LANSDENILMTDTTKFLLGPLFALIPVLLWELWIKPWRSRINIAKILREEADLNLGNLVRAKTWRLLKPGTIIQDFSLSTVVFEAVSGRIAELPSAIVNRTLLLYDRIHYLRLIASLSLEVRRVVREHGPLGDNTLTEQQLRSREYEAVSSTVSFDQALVASTKLAEELRSALTKYLKGRLATGVGDVSSVEDIHRACLDAARQKISVMSEFDPVRGPAGARSPTRG